MAKPGTTTRLATALVTSEPGPEHGNEITEHKRQHLYTQEPGWRCAGSVPGRVVRTPELDIQHDPGQWTLVMLALQSSADGEHVQRWYWYWCLCIENQWIDVILFALAADSAGCRD